MVRWNVSFGLPRFLFPDGLQYHACFDVLVGGIINIWPRYHKLFLSIDDLISSTFTILSTASLVMNSFYLMFRSLSMWSGNFLVSVRCCWLFSNF